MAGVKPGDEFAGQVGQLLDADWPARVESLRYSIELGALQPDAALQLVPRPPDHCQAQSFRLAATPGAHASAVRGSFSTGTRRNMR